MSFIANPPSRSGVIAAGLSAALTWFCASGASAADANYFGLTVAKPYAKDITPEVNFGSGVMLAGSETVEGEVQVGAMAGRQIGPLRLEAEYQYGRLKFGDPQLASASSAVSDDGDYHTLMANAYAVAPLTERLSLFAGAGVGWAWISIPEVRPGGSCDCFGAAERDDVAYQLRAGAEWAFATDHSVFVQYNWLRLPDARSTGAPITTYPHLKVSSVGVGYRRRF